MPDMGLTTSMEIEGNAVSGMCPYRELSRVNVGIGASRHKSTAFRCRLPRYPSGVVAQGYHADGSATRDSDEEFTGFGVRVGYRIRSRFKVGCESASQFSREYARYFGLPPLSEVRRTSNAAKA